jgi:hypothetical protein
MDTNRVIQMSKYDYENMDTLDLLIKEFHRLQYKSVIENKTPHIKLYTKIPNDEEKALILVDLDRLFDFNAELARRERLTPEVRDRERKERERKEREERDRERKEREEGEGEELGTRGQAATREISSDALVSTHGGGRVRVRSFINSLTKRRKSINRRKIKNRTLKKYNKAQIRRFNNKTKLNRTMKGGMIYTKYRDVQLKRIKEIMSELGHYKQPKLKKLLEKLEHLLINHTKTVSVTGIWQNNPEIDRLVNSVNTNLDSSIDGIPVENSTQPSYKSQTYKDTTNENRSPKERSGTRQYNKRQYSKRQSSKRQYTNTRSIISKSKGRGL